MSSDVQSLDNFFAKWLKARKLQDLPIEEQARMREAFMTGAFVVLQEIVQLSGSGFSHKIPTHLQSRYNETQFHLKKLGRKPGLLIS